jgi:hypothetical protein
MAWRDWLKTIIGVNGTRNSVAGRNLKRAFAYRRESGGANERRKLPEFRTLSE